MPKRNLFSYWAAIAFVVVGYFLAGKLGLSLASLHSNASPVWPPTGIALAAFIVWGPRIWPGIFLGAFLVNITTGGSFLTCLAISAGNTAEGVLGSFLIHRYANGRRVFDHPQSIFKFTFLAGLVATLISPTIGVTSLVLSGSAPGSAFGAIWFTWYVGDVVGALVGTPLFLLWLIKPKPEWTRQQKLEFTLVCLCTLLVGFSVFGGLFPFETRNHPLGFVCIPVLIWSAFRFGQQAAATTTFIMAVLATWGTVQGYGPFVRESPNESLLLLQAFMSTLAVMILSLAASVLENRLSQEELEKTQENLEKRIQERTTTLLTTIKALRLEMTERKQVQEILANSEKRFRNLVESTQDTIYTVSLDSKLLSLSPAFEMQTGWSCEDWLGKDFSPLVHPDDLPMVQETFLRIAQGHKVPKLEARISKKTGGYIVVETTMTPELVNGQTVCILGIARNVTDRKQAEEERLKLAQEQAARLVAETAQERATFLSEASALIFASLDYASVPSTVAHLASLRIADWCAVYLTSDDGNVSRMVVAHGDANKEPLIDRLKSTLSPDVDLFHPAIKAIRTGKPELIPQVSAALLNSIAPDANYRNVLETLGLGSYICVPMMSRGRKLGAILYARSPQARSYTKDDLDLAEELSRRAAFAIDNARLYNNMIQAQEALRKSEMELAKARDAAIESARLKSEFVANVSHEIRTPMNGIVGMTSLLLDSGLSIKQKEYSKTIRECCETLLSIINDILDFSKIESGKMTLEMQDFNLRTLIEGGLELLAPRAQFKGLEMVAFIPQDIPVDLRGDPNRLRQILVNLAGNAIKFTPKGSVAIRVTKEKETDDHVMLCLAIADTGVGISPSQQKHLFQPFTQADSSTTRKFGGTGLGLTICKRFVELMGGQMGLDSAPGRGSTFWFRLSFPKQKNVPLRANLKSKFKVLVMDGHETSRQALVEQIRALSLPVDSVAQLSQGLDMLRKAASNKEPYQVVVVDGTQMGREIMSFPKKIKAMRGFSSLRVVFLTPVHRPLDARALKRLKIDASFTKPIRQSTLFDYFASIGLKGVQPAAVKGKPTRRVKTKRARILVAEDNSVNQRVVLLLLKQLGYRADAVGNGVEAVEAMAHLPYDLVLMDCQMPEMDGFTATGEIRKQGNGAPHVPIIAMTANAMSGDREKCLAAGLDDYISKPIHVDELARVLGKWTERDEPVFTLKLPAGFDDPEFVQEITALFLKKVPLDLKRMKDAFDQKDAQELKLVAHSLKGACSHVGVHNMEKACRTIEETVCPQNLTEMGPVIEELHRYFSEIEKSLKESGGHSQSAAA